MNDTERLQRLYRRADISNNFTDNPISEQEFVAEVSALLDEAHDKAYIEAVKDRNNPVALVAELNIIAHRAKDSITGLVEGIEAQLKQERSTE